MQGVGKSWVDLKSALAAKLSVNPLAGSQMLDAGLEQLCGRRGRR
jgi:hypothetical protein